MTKPDTTQTYHAQVKKFFNTTAKAKARETKFVQHTSPLDGPLFLRTLVLCVFQHGVIKLGALAKLAQKIKPAVRLTEQAFKKRFTALAVKFLKAMFVEASQLTAPHAAQVMPLLQSFTAVYLLDASSVALPESLAQTYAGCGGAGPKAAAKVYLLLNWLTGAYETLQIEARRKADQDMGAQFLAGRQAGAEQIAKTTQNLAQLTQEISSATEEQSTGATAVVRSMEQLREVVCQAAEMANRLQGAAKDLQSQAEVL